MCCINVPLSNCAIFSRILHIVIRMHSRENHSDHERQLAKIISQGVSLHDWLDEDSEEQLNDEEINEFV